MLLSRPTKRTSPSVFLKKNSRAPRCFQKYSVTRALRLKSVGITYALSKKFDDYYPDAKTFGQVNSAINKRVVPTVADAILGKTPMAGKIKMNVKI